MTRDEAAAKLDGSRYGEEGSHELWVAMRSAGLVAVYGASDDLMEFSGAIHDEIGCYNGGTAYLTKVGLLESDCDNERCPYFEKMKAKAATIEAVWDRNGRSWEYETDIPHAKFIVVEDGEAYCEGIVFALADVLEREPAFPIGYDT